MGQSADVGRAQESLEVVQQQLTQLNQEFQLEADALASAYDPMIERFESLEVAPTRANVSVKLVALAWVPFARTRTGEVIPVYKEQT